MTNVSKGLLQHGRRSDSSTVEGRKDKHADGWTHRRTDMIPRWAFSGVVKKSKILNYTKKRQDVLVHSQLCDHA